MDFNSETFSICSSAGMGQIEMSNRLKLGSCQPILEIKMRLTWGVRRLCVRFQITHDF